MRYVDRPKVSDEVYYMEEEARVMASQLCEDGDLENLLTARGILLVHETLDHVCNLLSLLEDEDWVDEGGQQVITHILNVLKEGR